MRKDGWASGKAARQVIRKDTEMGQRQACLEMYLNEAGKEHEEIPSWKSILEAVQSRVNTGK